MEKAIIVPTCRKFKPWFDEFIQSIDTEYPIIVVYNTDEKNMYDVLGVTTGIDLGIEEFLVLHDTIIIKDNSLFDIIFKEHEGKTVFFNPDGKMFLNKYLLNDILNKGVDYKRLYSVNDKLSAVKAEGGFNQCLKDKVNPVVLFKDFIDGPKREQKHGRLNMVLENKYIKKYKGSWDGTTLREAERYEPK